MSSFLYFTVLLLPILSCSKNVNRQQYRTIKSYMDPSIDPCVDYYKYACGNWDKVHRTTDYYETIGYIDFKVNYEYARIFSTITKRQRLQSQAVFVRHASDYYKSCMAVEFYEPLLYLKWLKVNENIKWPAPLQSSSKRTTRKRQKKNDFDWLRMLAILRKYGLNGVFVEETVIQKRDDARVSIIDIDKPVISGGLQTLSFDWFTIIMDTFYISNSRSIQDLWDDFHVFEVKLKSLEDIEDDINYPDVQTLAQLNMTWLERYLSIVLNEVVDSQTEIAIHNLPYFKALFSVLDDYESEFLCRYLEIRFIYFLNISGPRNFFKLDCVAHTRSMLPLAMNWLYEKQNPELQQETKNIQILFKELQQHFVLTLHQNSNHFKAEILEFLLAKVESMQIKFGNLPRRSTDEKLKKFYSNLNITAVDFYANHLKALNHYTVAQHKRLKHLLPQNEDFFFIEDAETGASSSPYYLLRSNVIIVPLTLLHAPIYHPNLHDIFKFSSLGFLLAHEITHGFDDSGVEFDYHGNMRGPSELIKSNKLFDTNLDCLRSKNPQIIDEKIADVSGLRWAFETYFKNASTNAADPEDKRSLRFSDDSAERLFFLNFAQFFCGSASASELYMKAEHGSDRQRVLDTLANFEAFGRIYECPLGSRMHPKKKCQLWR